MLWVIIFTIALVAGLVLSVYFSTKSTYLRANSVYSDLGLAGNWKGESLSPFYKWGWRKATGKQVWAEKIIKKAFRKANIWLLHDDLLFFQKQCRTAESGGSVNDDEIKSYVDRIIQRTEVVERYVSGLVSGIIRDVATITPYHAQLYLKTDEVSVDPEAAIVVYGEKKIRETLEESGMLILGSGSKGMPLEDVSPSGKTYYLRGLGAWEQWLKAFETEIRKHTAQNFLGGNNECFPLLKKRLFEGVFRKYDRDLSFARTFRKSYHDAIQRKEISLTPEAVDSFDEYLYTWQFSNGESLHLAGHQVIRDALLRQELSLQFRENIILKTNSKSESLLKYIERFPLKVIFYDGNERARSFLANQYWNHLKALQEIAFSIDSKHEYEPPFIIVVSREEIDTAKFKRSKKSAGVEFGQDRESGKSSSKEPIIQLLQKQQQLGCVERQIDLKTGERRGWIINAEIFGDHPDELEELKQGPFADYVYYSCNIAADVDFESNVYHAIKTRCDIFNSVLASLTGISIPVTSLSGESTNGTSTDEAPANSSAAQVDSGAAA